MAVTLSFSLSVSVLVHSCGMKLFDDVESDSIIHCELIFSCECEMAILTQSLDIYIFSFLIESKRNVL